MHVSNNCSCRILLAQDLANYLLEYCHSRSNGRFRIAISGFPACGKSELAKRIATNAKKIACVETTYWVLDFDNPSRLHFSGVSPEAHNMHRLVSDLKRLELGRTVTVKPYNHLTGRHDATNIALSTEGAKVTVLVGCVLMDPLCADLYDYLAVLFPDSEAVWLANSVNRDLHVHSWHSRDFESATSYSRQKFEDSCLLFRRGSHLIDEAYRCSGVIRGLDGTLNYERIGRFPSDIREIIA